MTRKITMLDAMLHELRNPLTAVSTISDMLCSPDGEISKELLERYIDVLSQSSKEALEVLQRISKYSGSDLDNLEIKPERIEIIRALQKIIASSAGKAALIKDIKVQFKSDLEECYIEFTEILFQLLVTNLVGNAIKHSGGSNLIVSVRQDPVNNRQVQIIFEDDGVGISSQEMNAIFAPFKRGLNAKDGDGGKGIGLALVKQIVGAHGGDISLAPGPKGKGARFVVRLCCLGNPNLSSKR